MTILPIILPSILTTILTTFLTTIFGNNIAPGPSLLLQQVVFPMPSSLPCLGDKNLKIWKFWNSSFCVLLSSYCSNAIHLLDKSPSRCQSPLCPTTSPLARMVLAAGEEELFLLNCKLIILSPLLPPLSPDSSVASPGSIASSGHCPGPQSPLDAPFTSESPFSQASTPISIDNVFRTSIRCQLPHRSHLVLELRPQPTHPR